MSFFKQLFSAPEIIEKTVDGVFRGADKAWHTAEEKDDARQKYTKVYEKLWLAAVPSAISRRVIALAVTLAWLAIVVTLLVQGALCGAEACPAAEFSFRVMDDIVNAPFMIIVGFYFLKQVTDSIGLLKGKNDADG